MHIHHQNLEMLLQISYLMMWGALETRTVCFSVHTRPSMTVVVMRVLAWDVLISEIQNWNIGNRSSEFKNEAYRASCVGLLFGRSICLSVYLSVCWSVCLSSAQKSLYNQKSGFCSDIKTKRVSGNHQRKVRISHIHGDHYKLSQRFS